MTTKRLVIEDRPGRDYVVINGFKFAKRFFMELTDYLPIGEPFCVAIRKDGQIQVKRLWDRHHTIVDKASPETIKEMMAKALRRIPPSRLRALAEWFDLYDRTHGTRGNEVQHDLREMAALSEAALQENSKL